MAIKYEAYTRLGEKVKGVLPTDSEEDAAGILECDELIPYRLEQVKASKNLAERYPSLFKPKLQDVIDFTRQLVDRHPSNEG